MPWGTSAMNYARNAIGAAGWGAVALGTRWLEASPAARLGVFAGVGALYGGTFGTDPGESRLGQAFAGAMAGAAIYGAGRYGRAAFRGAQLANLDLLGGLGRAAGVTQRGGWPGILRGAGHGAYAQMRRDAQRAVAFIFGRKINRAVNPVSSTLKGAPAPVDLPPLNRPMPVPGFTPYGQQVPAPVRFGAPAPVRFSGPAPVQFPVPAPVTMSPAPVDLGPFTMERTNQELLERIIATRRALRLPTGVRLNMSPRVVATRRLQRDMIEAGLMR